MKNPLKEHSDRFSKVVRCIQTFYIVGFCVLFQSVLDIADRLIGEVQLVPMISWLNLFFSKPSHLQGLAYLCLLSVLPATFAPHSRSARALAGVTLLVFYGLFASIGDRMSSYSVYVWIGLYLILLPNWRGQPSRRVRQKVIFGWWICTGLFLMTYFMSGVWKVYNGMIVLPLEGEAGAFSPSAFSNIVGSYIIRSNQWPWLGEFILTHEWLGWFGYEAAIGLEVLAPLPLFFSKAYRAMAILLLLFHIMSIYLLHIAFSGHAFLIILLLYFSPFYGKAARS